MMNEFEDSKVEINEIIQNIFNIDEREIIDNSYNKQHSKKLSF